MDDKKIIVEWVSKIIKNCETHSHLDVAERLIISFQTRFRDDILKEKLESLLKEKLAELPPIYKPFI